MIGEDRPQYNKYNIPSITRSSGCYTAKEQCEGQWLEGHQQETSRIRGILAKFI